MAGHTGGRSSGRLWVRVTDAGQFEHPLPAEPGEQIVPGQPADPQLPPVDAAVSYQTPHPVVQQSGSVSSLSARRGDRTFYCDMTRDSYGVVSTLALVQVRFVFRGDRSASGARLAVAGQASVRGLQR